MKIKLVILLISLFKVSLGLVPLIPSESYTHTLDADDDDTKLYRVYWKLINNDNEILFELHCKTTGWVGFGLSPNGAMMGDFAIGWVDKNGKAYLKDTHSEKNSKPKIDKTQDWFLVDAKEVDGYTILKIKRSLITCDKENDLDIKTETNYLLFAWNDKDPITGDNDWDYHGKNKRTKVDMLLGFKSQDVGVDVNSELSQAMPIDLVLNDHPIKAQETYYYCKMFELPSFDYDVHLIGYDILVAKGNKDILHHIVVHECPLDVNTTVVEHECGLVDPSRGIQECLWSTITVIWGVGGTKTFSFPKNTGYPISKINKKRHYLIEYHFTNPKLETNRADSSGVRLYVTNKLRKDELGIMNFGSGNGFYDLQIPPKTQNIQFTSACYPECFEKFIPKEGITVFSGFLHTHLAGRSVRTKLVKDNKVVKYLFDNPKYDFNYQFNNDIEPIKLYKGDSLIIECNYNSMDRDNFTMWGVSTFDEMCYSFMYYYPRMKNFDTCYSSPPKEDIFEFYKSLKKDSLLKEEFNANSTWDYFQTRDYVKNFFNRVNYTDELRNRFVQYFKSPKNHQAVCGTAVQEFQDQLEYFTKEFPKPVENVVIETKACTNGVQTTSAPLIAEQSTTKMSSTANRFSISAFALAFALFSLIFNLNEN